VKTAAKCRVHTCPALSLANAACCMTTPGPLSGCGATKRMDHGKTESASTILTP